jgi:hypothetical protein
MRGLHACKGRLGQVDEGKRPAHEAVALVDQTDFPERTRA